MPKRKRGLQGIDQIVLSLTARGLTTGEIRSIDPTGGGRARWMIRWKPALNAFAITFAERFEELTHRLSDSPIRAY